MLQPAPCYHPRPTLSSATKAKGEMQKQACREYKDCCALIFTETWLTEDIPDSVCHLQTHSIHTHLHLIRAGLAEFAMFIYTNHIYKAYIERQSLC